MSEVQKVVGHHAAAAIHIETADLRWGFAVERLRAGDAVEADYHAQIACANLVFAAHHAAEAERAATVASASASCSVAPARGQDPRKMS